MLPQYKKRLKKLGKFPIVIGVPTKNVKETIVHVLHNVIEGLHHYFSERALIVIADGGSTDYTLDFAEMHPTPKDVELFILKEEKPYGKGSAVKSIIEAGMQVNAYSISLVDSDLVSISPEWIPLLAKPTLYGRAHFVAPYYHRDKYDGMITNLLAYPFTRAVYGGNRRQPLGGEISISQEFAAELLKEDIPHDWGIDIFITTHALVNQLPINEAILGRKIHGSVQHYLKPKEHLEPMFLEVTGQMFKLAHKFASVWTKQKVEETSLERYNVKGYRAGIMPIPIKIEKERIKKSYVEGVHKYKKAFAHICRACNFSKRELLHPSNGIDEEAWARAVYGTALKSAHKRNQHLLKLLPSLWHGRFYNYIKKTEKLDTEEAEKFIDLQFQAFKKYRKTFQKDILECCIPNNKQD